MSFKLRIPGRDSLEAAVVANPANLLIAVAAAKPISGIAGLAANDAPNESPSISGIAGLAASATCDSERDARIERSAIISAEGAPYWQADELAGLPPWTDAEIELFQRRQARITWSGYGSHAERLAEKLLHRDRDSDDRNLCVECDHAGPGWRCAKREAFLLDQLQRCPAFKATAS